MLAVNTSKTVQSNTVLVNQFVDLNVTLVLISQKDDDWIVCDKLCL
jgi:hypothetical protein